jgi:hypothetical protein
VQISQNGVVRQVHLGPRQKSVQDNVTGVAASLTAEIYDVLSIPFLSGYKYMVDPSNPSSAFFVPKMGLLYDTFCSAPSSTNCLGMTLSTWLLNQVCSTPANYFTQISGSTATDQWSQFRSNTMGRVVQQCVWIW